MILQTSRLEPWKGQRLLVEALGRIKHFPWRLGSPEDRLVSRKPISDASSKRSLASSDSGTDHFPRRENDISDLLAAADVFCQPNIERKP